MAAHALLKNYTAPRIATTNMCAKFRDDLVPLSRPARFHAKENKKNTIFFFLKYKKKIQNDNGFFPPYVVKLKDSLASLAHPITFELKYII